MNSSLSPADTRLLATALRKFAARSVFTDKRERASWMVGALWSASVLHDEVDVSWMTEFDRGVAIDAVRQRIDVIEDPDVIFACGRIVKVLQAPGLVGIGA